MSSSSAPSPHLRRRPMVAIVGRPNVGKSSLFNRMVGERRAIVEPTAGVTRDRLVLPVELPDTHRRLDLMDTGGIGIVDREDLAASVEVQVQTALHAASLVLFVVDTREGLTLLDEQVARQLRRSDVPVLLVGNKCETRAAQDAVRDFDRLGFGPAHPLSAQEGLGLGELYNRLEAQLPEGEEEELQDRVGIAVMGRRNTGKSSFVNALLGEPRVIVSDLAGTTRDAIDIDLDWEGHALTLVDTAGVHRRGKVANAVEYFSLTRSDQALRRADVALLFLDLTQPIARLDQELGRTIHDRHKPVVVVGTKADLVPELSIQDFRDQVEHRLPHLRGAPLVMISNLSGRGLNRVLKAAIALREEAGRQVGTGELNRAITAMSANLRFRGRSEKPRIYYATQIGVHPPSFLLFVNRKRLFEKEALRAIERDLSRRLDFPQVPIRIVLRERKRSESKKSR